MRGKLGSNAGAKGKAACHSTGRHVYRGLDELKAPSGQSSKLYVLRLPLARVIPVPASASQLALTAATKSQSVWQGFDEVLLEAVPNLFEVDFLHNADPES